MNSLLSAVTGQFGKSLVFGALLPVIVFGLAGWLWVVPLLPPDLGPWAALRAMDLEWKLGMATLAALIAAGLLQTLNIPIIRFYEGYPWKVSWIGAFLTRRQRARFDLERACWTGLRTLRYTEPTKEVEAKLGALTERWKKAGMAINREFPARREQVLPTRLGNVIRSFESYPDHQYGMDAIALWPRLVGVIDETYAGVIADAKTGFDSMLHASVLSALLAGAALVAGLLHPLPLASAGRCSAWLVEIALFSFVSHLLYRVAVGRAAAWGGTVKSAFDLYRFELLKQLGYADAPGSRAAERELWDTLSLQMIFGDSPRVHLPRYAAKRRSAVSDPPGIDLALARGVTPFGSDRELLVTLSIENRDSSGRMAQKVVLTDELPEGFEYVWGSARALGYAVSVDGAGPYRFTFAGLPAGQSAIVTYRILRREKD